jgi:uncharacterized protein with HEPN domain
VDLKDDRLYLTHIAECIERIQDYVSGGANSFLHTRLVQDAVLRNLQTMAESSQRLSDDAKDKRPEIDWRRIAGFRNVLAHDYLGLDIELIWRIVEMELPGLQEAVKAMLKDSETDV